MDILLCGAAFDDLTVRKEKTEAQNNEILRQLDSEMISKLIYVVSDPPELGGNKPE